MAGKLRKLFSNDEVAEAGTHAHPEVFLSELRGRTISRQTYAYWKKHLETTKRNGEPYAGTGVIDKVIRNTMTLRTPTEDDYTASTDQVEDNSCILVIPDQHAPYQHPDAIRFLSDVADAISPTRVINLGDETDGHGLSMHDSDPNLDSAGVELHGAQQFLSKLADRFPVMDICHSNHGSLIYRRAYKHGIPVEYIKSYRDVLFPDGGGDGWSWQDKVVVKLPNGQLTIFQHQSAGDILANAAHEGCNIVEGHQHGICEVRYRASTTKLYWSMLSGCIIDGAALAFAYGKLFPKKPIIACSAIIDSQPIIYPMPMDEHGRYTGELGGVTNG